MPIESQIDRAKTLPILKKTARSRHLDCTAKAAISLPCEDDKTKKQEIRKVEKKQLQQKNQK